MAALSEEVAKLLIYLSKCNLQDSLWFSGLKELIDKLLKQDISSEQKQKLNEIKIQL